MSEEISDYEHNDIKYERILRRQCNSLEHMYNLHKYHHYGYAGVSKFMGFSNHRPWFEKLKKHLRKASRHKPYFNIVMSLLNINNESELISNDIYGLDPQLITNMLGEVVTDPVERRERVWEVRDTLERIAYTYGFREHANEFYMHIKGHEEVKRLKDIQVDYDDEDGIANFDFVYQWYIVNKFQKY